jgi:hypothetical protein
MQVPESFSNRDTIRGRSEFEPRHHLRPLGEKPGANVVTWANVGLPNAVSGEPNGVVFVALNDSSRAFSRTANSLRKPRSML